MGYYAEMDANFAFTKQVDLPALTTKITAVIAGHYAGVPTVSNVEEVFQLLADEVDWDSTNVPGVIGSSVSAYGQVKYSSGWHEPILEALAEYCEGVAEFRGEDGALWMIRLANGTSQVSEGITVYPNDPGTSPAAADWVAAAQQKSQAAVEVAEITLRIPWVPAQHDHPALWKWQEILGTPRPVTVITKEKA